MWKLDRKGENEDWNFMKLERNPVEYRKGREKWGGKGGVWGNQIDRIILVCIYMYKSIKMNPTTTYNYNAPVKIVEKNMSLILWHLKAFDISPHLMPQVRWVLVHSLVLFLTSLS